MKLKTIAALAAFAFSTPVLSMVEDDPLVYQVMLEKLEWRAMEGPDPLVLDGDAWVGYDLNKLRLKTEIEHVDGAVEEGELQLLYSRAVSAYWDIQTGWRRDFEPDPERDFFVLGFSGLAPYWFEVDASLFLGESGQSGVRLDAEYEYMLTQRWVLSPELEFDIYTEDDEQVGIGSGFSSMELGLRLRYEVRREIAPYIGVNWEKKFGRTADLAAAEGESASDVQFVAGIRAWF